MYICTHSKCSMTLNMLILSVSRSCP
jgi:hypothetical protein